MSDDVFWTKGKANPNGIDLAGCMDFPGLLQM